MALLWDLFITFFKIGAFSFGGGYAMLPLMQEEVIATHGWLSITEFLDIVAIAEMTPGPIAVNMATFLGYKVSGGILGSVMTTLGVILPSFIVVLILVKVFLKFQSSPVIQSALRGIRPTILALITSAALLLIEGAIVDIFGIVIAIGVFYLVAFRKFNPILVILLSGMAGIMIY